MSSFRIRPMGQVIAEVRQPYMRFGMAVMFAIQTPTDEMHVAKVREDGQLTYDRVDRRVEATPTIELDDNEWEALHRAVNNLPARFHGAGFLDHLADAIKQRDEAFRQLAEANTNHHELAMKTLGS